VIESTKLFHFRPQLPFDSIVVIYAIITFSVWLAVTSMKLSHKFVARNTVPQLQREIMDTAITKQCANRWLNTDIKWRGEKIPEFSKGLII